MKFTIFSLSLLVASVRVYGRIEIAKHTRPLEDWSRYDKDAGVKKEHRFHINERNGVFSYVSPPYDGNAFDPRHRPVADDRYFTLNDDDVSTYGEKYRLNDGDGGESGEGIRIVLRQLSRGIVYNRNYIEPIKVVIHNYVNHTLRVVHESIDFGRWFDCPRRVLGSSDASIMVMGGHSTGYHARVAYSYGERVGGGEFSMVLAAPNRHTVTDYTFDIRFSHATEFASKYVIKLHDTLLPIRKIVISIFEREPETFNVMVGADTLAYQTALGYDEARWYDNANIMMSLVDPRRYKFGLVSGDKTRYGQKGERVGLKIGIDDAVGFPILYSVGSTEISTEACYEGDWKTGSGCAMSAIRDMHRRLYSYTKSLQNMHYDWIATDKGGRGSLSYGFDYGEYRFIQLAGRFDDSRVLEDDGTVYEITPSLMWLENELKASADKNVIVLTNLASETPTDFVLIDLVRKYGVRLMFRSGAHRLALERYGDTTVIAVGGMCDHESTDDGGYIDLTLQNDHCAHLDSVGQPDSNHRVSGTVCFRNSTDTLSFK